MREENKFITFLKQIAPYLIRALNSFLYFILKSIKSIIRMIIDQIKGAY